MNQILSDKVVIYKYFPLIKNLIAYKKNKKHFNDTAYYKRKLMRTRTEIRHPRRKINKKYGERSLQEFIRNFVYRNKKIKNNNKIFVKINFY